MSEDKSTIIVSYDATKIDIDKLDEDQKLTSDEIDEVFDIDAELKAKYR